MNPKYEPLLKEYIEECKLLEVKPDGGLLCALECNTKTLKPSRNYTESEFYAIMKFLIKLSEHKSITFPFTKVQFYGGRIGKYYNRSIIVFYVYYTLYDINILIFYIIGSNGAMMLAEFLRKNKTVEHISVINNLIGPRGAYAISDVFADGANKTLRVLDLHGNRIYHKGGVALAKALKKGKHMLEVIDVSNNHIGFEAVVQLHLAIRKNQAGKLISMDTSSNFVFEETWNSISHGVGFFLSIIATFFSLYKIYMLDLGSEKVASALIYCGSLIFLYLCSSLYHSFFKLGTTKDIFQKLDHAAIFVLIAGSYTPMLLGGPLDGYYGRLFLSFVWFIAFFGIGLVCFCFNKYPTVELGLYLAMGWISLVFGPIIYEHWQEFVTGTVISINGFIWYGVGGLVYSIGVYFFLKGVHIPIHHATWHVFVVVASFCHFIGYYYYVLPVGPPEVPFW